MTKKEALELEKLCDNRLTTTVHENCQTSMTLTGKLKINFGENSVSFNDDLSVCYINYRGFYGDMKRIIKKIKGCVLGHKDDFDRLLWSYNNRGRLTEGEK